jgi:hypothetical protein
MAKSKMKGEEVEDTKSRLMTSEEGEAGGESGTGCGKTREHHKEEEEEEEDEEEEDDDDEEEG